MSVYLAFNECLLPGHIVGSWRQNDDYESYILKDLTLNNQGNSQV